MRRFGKLIRALSRNSGGSMAHRHQYVKKSGTRNVLKRQASEAATFS